MNHKTTNILITGASRGLGLALANVLGALGARVVLVARHSDALNAAVNDLRGRGIGAHGITADVGDERAIHRISGQAAALVGDIDVLINNASTLGPTHAAGLSATGDERIDAALPLPEHYQIPKRTASLIAAVQANGGRVIAIGTTVVRALEASAATHGRVVAGAGTARNRISHGTELKVVDGLLTGMHETGASHYKLLKAFASSALLENSWKRAEASGFLNHELGDLALVHRKSRQAFNHLGSQSGVGSQNRPRSAKRPRHQERLNPRRLMPGLSLLNQLGRHH